MAADIGFIAETVGDCHEIGLPKQSARGLVVIAEHPMLGTQKGGAVV